MTIGKLFEFARKPVQPGFIAQFVQKCWWNENIFACPLRIGINLKMRLISIRARSYVHNF